MKVVTVAGLNLHSATKIQVLQAIEERVAKGLQTSIITPYSEFLVAALRDGSLMSLFNSATISIPDGIGVIWAEKFLSVPLSAHSYYLKILQAGWQMIWTGAAILLWPSVLYKVFPQKLVGADFFWDLCELAEKQQLPVYFLGGQGTVSQEVSELALKKFPILKVAGYSNKHWQDETIIDDLNASGARCVFVAFSPPNQERWVIEKLPQTQALIAIGLGGTFDYATGHKLSPPKFIRSLGLEWIFRLLTQPTRLKRILTAFFGLIVALIRVKVFSSMPYRVNVVAVIQHISGDILICQRNPLGTAYGGANGHKLVDYWQFPQGGINRREDLVSGAKREAFEEVGLKDLKFMQLHENAFEYSWRNAVRKLWFNSLKYSGQRQSLVFFSYAGAKNEVRLDNKEFTDYRWVGLDQLPAMLHPERLALAEIVVRDLQKSS